MRKWGDGEFCFVCVCIRVLCLCLGSFRRIGYFICFPSLFGEFLGVCVDYRAFMLLRLFKEPSLGV